MENQNVRKPIKANIVYDAVNAVYGATLLGGEFSNCDGCGKTPEQALMVLKIRVHQLRRSSIARGCKEHGFWECNCYYKNN